ncbi:MAG: LemA family protein [Parcubacteria group bacterium]|jgi:LemA protein
MKLKDLFCIFFIVMGLLFIWKFGNSHDVEKISEEEANPAWQELLSAYKNREDVAMSIVGAVDKYNISSNRKLVLSVVTAREKASLITPANKFNNSQAITPQFKLIQDELNRALAELINVLGGIPEIEADDNFNKLKFRLREANNRINYALAKYEKTRGATKKNMTTSFWR